MRRATCAGSSRPSSRGSAASATIRSFVYPPIGKTFARDSRGGEERAQPSRARRGALLARAARRHELNRKSSPQRKPTWSRRLRRGASATTSSRAPLPALRNAPRGAWVARDADTPIAIAFAHELRNRMVRLDLYVEPSFRGAGLGWKLLRQATSDSGERIAGRPRSTPTTSASLAFFLATRHGICTCRCCAFRARFRVKKICCRWPPADYRFQTAPIDPHAHAYALDGLDREVRGTARAATTTSASRSCATRHGVLSLNDECVGYAYVWPDGRIGPMVAASARYTWCFFGFALAVAAAHVRRDVVQGTRAAAATCGLMRARGAHRA